MVDDKKTLKFQMMMSPSEAETLDDWMFRNRVRSRAEAIRRLTQIALALEPLVYGLKGIWRDVQSADSEIGGQLIEAWANRDSVPTEDHLKALSRAADRLVPAALEFGVHADMMAEIFSAIKAGEDVNESVAKMKDHMDDREKLRDFIHNTFGPKD